MEDVETPNCRATSTIGMPQPPTKLRATSTLNRKISQSALTPRPFVELVNNVASYYSPTLLVERGQDFFLRMTLNGHEVGNGGYSQGPT